MPEDLDDDTPQQDGTVEAAAAAIAGLMALQPDAGEEEEAQAKPVEDEGAQKPVTPDVVMPDPGAVEAARKMQEAEAARQQFTAALNHLLPQLQSAIAGEFGDIRSPAEAARLAESDPARYNRYITAQNNLAQAQHQRQALAAQENQAAQARWAQWAGGEQKKIGDLVPELRDPETGPALATKILRFAQKAGYSVQQISGASATDMAMLHRAMQFENLQGAQAAAKAKAAHAPKVSEPGTRAQGGGREADAQADFARLKKSGRTEDAAALFRNIL